MVNTSGKFIPKTMIVIIIANTPSLKASNLPFDNVCALLSCLVIYDMGLFSIAYFISKKAIAIWREKIWYNRIKLTLKGA